VELPGGPLQIHWDAASGKVFMDGPAEHVFDALIPDPRAVAEARRLAAEGSAALAQAPALETPPGPAPEVDCATVCTNGCIRPDNCPSAEARARVAALLSGSSLDDLVTLATNTLESRTRARFERDTGLGS
jgi:diaminopimelate epimerase